MIYVTSHPKRELLLFSRDPMPMREVVALLQTTGHGAQPVALYSGLKRDDAAPLAPMPLYLLLNPQAQA